MHSNCHFLAPIHLWEGGGVRMSVSQGSGGTEGQYDSSEPLLSWYLPPDYLLCTQSCNRHRLVRGLNDKCIGFL